MTVVVTMFNRGRYIADTLDSVLAQSHRHLEVIVIDDGSEDDGPDIVRRYLSDPRLSLAMKPHLGISGNRNAGASLASPSSEYLIFMDDDDTWAPEMLETLVAALGSHPEACGAFARAEYTDEAGTVMRPGEFARKMRTRERLASPDGPALGILRGLEHAFLAMPVAPMGTLLIRRDAFSSTGGFDPSFPVGEDWDFLARMVRKMPIVVVERALVGYRRHTSNISANAPLNVRTVRRLWATVYYSPENSPEQAAMLAAIWRSHHRRTSARKLAEARLMIAGGRPFGGLLRMADAMGHRLLRRPLRVWTRPVAPVPRYALGDVPIAVERGPHFAPW